jgi:Tfp pilus assembly protein PilW
MALIFTWRVTRRAIARARSARGLGMTELMVTTAIALTVLGIVVQVSLQSQGMFRKQRQFGEARENVSATLDMITRLVRIANVINPDPDGDGLMNSIRLQADWNPQNGVLTDPYEVITFSTNGTQLLKQEPSDSGPIPFAERVGTLTFAYFDTNNNPVTNPVATPRRIAFVRIGAQTTTIDGLPGVAISSAAAVRVAE